jgi:hypothetical protein
MALVLAVGVGIMSHAKANAYAVRPISLVADSNFSVSVTGSVGTLGNTRAISDWNVPVTTAERLAH